MKNDEAYPFAVEEGEDECPPKCLRTGDCVGGVACPVAFNVPIPRFDN